MKIRLATELDYPQLRQIYLESRLKTFEWENPDEMALEDFDKQTVDEYIIVAEENLQIVGFASLYLPDDFIHLLFVQPDCFGKGAGSKLLHAAIEKMNKPLTLKCVSKNQKAMNFYESKGWRRVIEEGNPEKYWIMAYE